MRSLRFRSLSAAAACAEFGTAAPGRRTTAPDAGFGADIAETTLGCSVAAAGAEGFLYRENILGPLT